MQTYRFYIETVGPDRQYHEWTGLTRGQAKYRYHCAAKRMFYKGMELCVCGWEPVRGGSL